MINKKFAGLNKRFERSYESRDDKKRAVVKALNFKKIGNVEFYKPEEGNNAIDILPYEIKTKNHPLVRTGEAQIGEWDYLLDYFVHKTVGAGNAQVLCLKNTFGKPCPICEQMANYRKQGKDEEAKALKPSRRVCYNVLDPKDGKVKIFDVSHFLFEKELIEEARDGGNGEYIMFSHPENGKTVSFRAVVEKAPTGEYLKFKGFKFLDREPISEEVLNKTISLDEAMTVPTFEEVERLFFNADDTDEGIEENNVDTDDVKEVVRTEVDNPKTVETPTEVKKPKKEGKSDNPCPCGHTFGIDANVFDECDDCDMWDKCCKAKNKG